MTNKMTGVILGVALLVAGLLLLLQTLGVTTASGVYWGILFVVTGGVFWYLFATDGERWWAAIPGGALVGLGLSMLLDSAGATDGQWGGAAFLGLLGIGFVAVYVSDQQHWWALIPGGVLLTLAVQAILSVLGATGRASGALFFAGLAVTFALIALLPTGQERHRWAWIPAGVLLVLAIVVALDATRWLNALNYVWPIALIAGGGFLLWRALSQRQVHEGEPTSQPPADRPGHSNDRAHR